jgi:hypothetical protein
MYPPEIQKSDKNQNCVLLEHGHLAPRQGRRNGLGSLVADVVCAETVRSESELWESLFLVGYKRRFSKILPKRAYSSGMLPRRVLRMDLAGTHAREEANEIERMWI